jgi:hypothetical protein
MTVMVNIHEAKTHLSRLLAVARLVPSRDLDAATVLAAVGALAPLGAV